MTAEDNTTPATKADIQTLMQYVSDAFGELEKQMDQMEERMEKRMDRMEENMVTGEDLKLLFPQSR